MTVISVYWILLILCISSNGFTFSGGWRRMGSFQSLLSASSKTNLINEGENGKIGNHNCFLPDNKEKESGYSTHFSFDRDKSPDLPPPSAMPMKAIIFIDGSWLHHSLILNRVNRTNHNILSYSPLKQRFGSAWARTLKIDWLRLPLIIANQLSRQLTAQYSVRRQVEIVRTSVFTSLSRGANAREPLVEEFHRANFDVHIYETNPNTKQEKCVDIALATELLYLSAMSDSFDIAVIVSGDRDYLPALEKTRLLSKRVAICSMRKTCNRAFQDQKGIRDFDIIWIDDFLEQLVTPLDRSSVDTYLLEILFKLMVKLHLYDYYTEHWLESRLTNFLINREKNAFELLKEYHPSFRSFLERYPEYFRIEETEDLILRYMIIPNRPQMAEWMGYNITTAGNTSNTNTTTEELMLYTTPLTSSIQMIKQIMNETEKTLEAGQKFLVEQQHALSLPSLPQPVIISSSSSSSESLHTPTNVTGNSSSVMSVPGKRQPIIRSTSNRVAIRVANRVSKNAFKTFLQQSNSSSNTFQDYQRFLQQTEKYYELYLALIRSNIQDNKVISPAEEVALLMTVKLHLDTTKSPIQRVTMTPNHVGQELKEVQYSGKLTLLDCMKKKYSSTAGFLKSVPNLFSYALNRTALQPMAFDQLKTSIESV